MVRFSTIQQLFGFVENFVTKIPYQFSPIQNFRNFWLNGRQNLPNTFKSTSSFIGRG